MRRDGEVGAALSNGGFRDFHTHAAGAGGIAAYALLSGVMTCTAKAD
jgi:hypothetical protein